MKFELHQVAALNGSGGYTLTASFQDSKVNLTSIGRDQAISLAAYTKDKGIAPMDSGRTSGGSLTFQGLEDGLYLVVGIPYSSGGDTYTPVPFLVVLSGGDTVTAQVKHDQTGDGPDTPDKPDPPDEPDTPDKPDTPDTPDTPDQPDVPDTPDMPDTPDTPEQPDTPDTPDEPEQPDIPQTGQLWWLVPLLACGGMGLFLMGWLKRRNGGCGGTNE